jgi:hypothetical protein
MLQPDSGMGKETTIMEEVGIGDATARIPELTGNLRYRYNATSTYNT